MRLYKCAWPNGDISVVLARDKDEAVYRLDEWGTATADMLVEIRTFMADFVLRNGPEVLAHDARIAAAATHEAADLLIDCAPELVQSVHFCDQTREKVMWSIDSWEGAVDTAAEQAAHREELPT